jgi:small multidrug resistance pump
MWGALALLALAIGSEAAATASLPRTEGFRSPGWSLLVVSGYAASIWLLSLVVREIPVSTAYAVWAGSGTALVAVVGVVWLGEDWNWVTVIALAMIIVGVVALNMSGAH